jgi:hypothetical protein
LAAAIFAPATELTSQREEDAITQNRGNFIPWTKKMHLNAGEVLSKTPLRQLAGRAYQVAKIDFPPAPSVRM